jgi:hypothetical protein
MKILEEVAEKIYITLEEDTDKKVKRFERRMDAITRTFATITITGSFCVIIVAYFIQELG